MLNTKTAKEFEKYLVSTSREGETKKLAAKQTINITKITSDLKFWIEVQK